MNQILATENQNYKKNKAKLNGSKDVNSIVKFFAIILIIFGLFLIINSSYALYKGEGETKLSSTQKEPDIQIEKKGEDKVLIRIMHEDVIEIVNYNWDGQNSKTINGNGRKYIQEEVEIPNGKNTLYVTAKDVNGNVKKLNEEFESISKINIDISISENNIKVQLESKENINKFTYAWDEEDVNEVEVNDMKYVMEIEAPLGRHTLTVVATDINGEEVEKTQDVVGTKKPTVKLEKGDNAYVIKAFDEIGLDRIEVTTLNDGKVTKIQSDGKEFEYNFPLKQGNDNFIEVIAYNENGVASDKLRAKWPK